MVLERMLGMALDAELERIMHADGIEWRINDPARMPSVANGDNAEP